MKLFHSVSGNDVTSVWLASFPLNLQQLREIIIGGDIKFNVYVICHKCHSLYDFDDCIDKNGSRNVTKLCKYVPFPNHPMASFRKACATSLLRSGTEKDQFRPFKVYPYQNLKDSIGRLLKHPGFLEKCEVWRERSSAPNCLGDVYDGNVWGDFSSFLSQRYSWCLALNVDWFQPFSHVCDSVGAIYLIIQNLPRKERYKRENMILVSIIPGPKEPSLNINVYLTPLVYELKEFYNGMRQTCISQDGCYYRSVLIRLALTCVVYKK